MGDFYLENEKLNAKLRADNKESIEERCNERLEKQMAFSVEIDKMTGILRRTLLIDQARRENDAEHSWHIAVMALVFSEYATEKVDVEHSVCLCIVHDLIEIYAGDTFAYDREGNKTKAKREKDAADKLFAILPTDQNKNVRSLWEEFEKNETSEAKFANCMDRLQPFLHNTLTGGHTWAENGTEYRKVVDRMSIIKDFMPKIWPWIEKNLEFAVKNGWLKR